MTALAGLAHVGESGGRDVHSHESVRGFVDCDRIDHDLAAGAGRIGKGGENGASGGGKGASDSGGEGEGISRVIQRRPDYLAALVSNFRTLHVAGFSERLDKSPCFCSDAENKASSSDGGGCHIVLNFVSTRYGVRFGNDGKTESPADRSLLIVSFRLNVIHLGVIAAGRSDGRGGIKPSGQ